MNREILEKLQAISFFDEIKSDTGKMELVIGICRTRDCRKGQVIFRENDMGSEMFIAMKGGVEIQKRTRAGDSYTVVTLRSADNVYFGELALIDDESRSATVVATEDSSFIVISKSDFLELGKSHPEIALPITQAIARLLAKRMRKTTQDMLTIFDALVNEVEA